MKWLLSALIFYATLAPAQALPRVMSLNLCADAYLMHFAAKTQVVALTPQSRDANLSAMAETAQSYPISDGQIESIAALAPDLVIVSSYSDPLRNRLIEKLGIPLLVQNAANGFGAARAEMLSLGDAIGRPRQAAAYVKQLEAQLAALKPVPHRPRILPLQRRNLTVGRGHILDEIIALAGGLNVGRQISAQTMGRVSLETALAHSPDYILVNARADGFRGPDSRGMEFLTHPALARRYSAEQRLWIDNNLLVCAGATTPLAVETLLSQIRRPSYK
jgi:iron complex transport system substrate-binding protein